MKVCDINGTQWIWNKNWELGQIGGLVKLNSGEIKCQRNALILLNVFGTGDVELSQDEQ